MSIKASRGEPIGAIWRALDPAEKTPLEAEAQPRCGEWRKKNTKCIVHENSCSEWFCPRRGSPGKRQAESIDPFRARPVSCVDRIVARPAKAAAASQRTAWCGGG